MLLVCFPCLSYVWFFHRAMSQRFPIPVRSLLLAAGLGTVSWDAEFCSGLCTVPPAAFTGADYAPLRIRALSEAMTVLLDLLASVSCAHAKQHFWCLNGHILHHTPKLTQTCKNSKLTLCIYSVCCIQQAVRIRFDPAGILDMSMQSNSRYMMMISDHRPRHICAEREYHNDSLPDWLYHTLPISHVSPWRQCSYRFLFQSRGFSADQIDQMARFSMVFHGFPIPFGGDLTRNATHRTEIGARVLPQGLAAGVGFQDQQMCQLRSQLALCSYRKFECHFMIIFNNTTQDVSRCNLFGKSTGKNQTWNWAFATDFTSSQALLRLQVVLPEGEALAICLSHGFMMWTSI